VAVKTVFGILVGSLIAAVVASVVLVTTVDRHAAAARGVNQRPDPPSRILGIRR
jgi:hypothetical protein